MLEEYKKKRDFGKTKEPAGRSIKSIKGTRSIKSKLFVVQEHHASHLHGDFRLEIEGVLKSWAVPKMPPIKIGEKRLAIQVEDHPLEYADFEGEIAKGEYGAGKVKIWDKGTYKLLNMDKDLLELELNGKKLKGKYVLFHPKKFEAKNWLLFKK